MRKILLFLSLLIPSVSFAQGTSINGVAFYNSSGTLRVVPSAVITVCGAADGSIPCISKVSIYSNVSLTVPKSNPFNADINGNYQYFVASGSSYTETVTGVGVQGFSRQVGGGGGGGGAISLSSTLPIVVTPDPITGTGTASCPSCNTSSATIGGSIANTQIAFGSGANTIHGDSNHIVAASGSTQLTATADTNRVFELFPHSGTQSASLGIVSQGGTSSDCQGTFCIVGEGNGSVQSLPTLLDIVQNSDNPFGLSVRNRNGLTDNEFSMSIESNGVAELSYCSTTNTCGGITYTQNVGGSNIIITPSNPGPNPKVVSFFYGAITAGRADFLGTLLTGTHSFTFPNQDGVFTLTIASGTATLGTSLIASGACATVVTVAGTGIATTDNIMADFNADPTSTTGYSASANGMLTIIKYPTSGNVNFKVCNNTQAGITPGAATLNWRVVR